MPGIPAAALLPPAFGELPDHFWRPNDVEKGGQARIFPASPISSGWRYFTVDREIRLSPDYPSGYEADIGYKFNHGPGKVDKEGRPAEEKAKPASIWIMRAWHVERERMICAIIDSFSLQKKIQKIYANDEYLMLDSGISNFYLTIFHDAKPSTPANTYDATGSLRTLRNEQAYVEAAKPWFPENYWAGLNPLEPRADQEAAAEAARAARLPATVRDANGADEFVELRQPANEPNW